MAVKKSIAIVVATEKTGVQISKQFAKNDCHLLLVSNNEKELEQLLNRINSNQPKAEIDTISCVKDGCWEADIIILITATKDEKEIVDTIKEVATQKIVVQILSQPHDSISLQQLLPYSKVVVIADISQSPSIMITGNDNEANEEISMIFQEAGYQSIICNSFLKQKQ
ncbi:MAG: hypothetical protein Q8891_08955 [Bacteroidota bacterium]|nr:hypothetical protein [Bacteroidota bacterium]